MNVFITNQHGKEKLVQAFKDAGAAVVINYGELGDDVKLIIPTVDEELPFFARARHYFNSKGIRVMVSNEDAINITRDKAEFARFCRRHNFPIPETCQFEAIVKPRFGKGSKGLSYIDRSMICQQILKGTEYSIDYFADFDGNIKSVVPRIRLDVVNGESQNGRVDYNPVIISLCMRMGSELNLVGQNTFQGFLVGNQFYFTEVNCRFGGGFWLTQKEAPTVQWLLKLVNGESLNAPSNLPQMPA